METATILVSYLTPVSDLDLAPPTDQFVASPPLKLDPDGHLFSLEKFNMSLWTPYKVILKWLKFDRGGV